jgi:hypothetical protein
VVLELWTMELSGAQFPRKAKGWRELLLRSSLSAEMYIPGEKTGFSLLLHVV